MTCFAELFKRMENEKLMSGIIENAYKFFSHSLQEYPSYDPIVSEYYCILKGMIWGLYISFVISDEEKNTLFDLLLNMRHGEVNTDEQYITAVEAK